MADVVRADRSHPQPIPVMAIPVRDRLGTPWPVSLTSFVGREREVAAVAEMLRRDDVRLVTLTGPGGVGKTRLALRVVDDVAAGFTDGVAFVPLAPISDPALVLPAVAHALGVQPAGDRPLDEQVGAVLGGTRRLALLDNLEQVPDAAPLLAALLVACPGLKLLVTSRESLHLSGEHEFPVPPLPLPGTADLPDLEALRRVEAVALFEERARAVRSDFALTAENAPAVAALCAQLDGLPLAIELAAARAKIFAPQALLARLDRRLGLLTGGPRDAPVRLRSLRDAIAWSHALLTHDEQRLFRRVAVFAGGFTLEAVEAVCHGWEADPSGGQGASDDAHLEPPATPLLVLEGIASLVDKSLLRRAEQGDHQPRFGMLETIREFALERLAASSEEEAVRDRHAAWCLNLAERFSEDCIDWVENPRWLSRVEPEHDNLRAALAWLERAGDGERLLRLAGVIQPFWDVRGHRTEAVAWLERGLDLGQDAPAGARLLALAGLGRHLERQGHYERARALNEERVALARVLGDAGEEARARRALAVVAVNQERYDEATPLIEEAMAAFEQAGDEGGICRAHYLSGVITYGQGDLVTAAAHVEAAVAWRRDRGSVTNLAIPLIALGLIECEQGDYARAAVRLADGLASLQRDRVGNREVLAEWLAAVARLAAGRGQGSVAARLYGAAEALFDAVGVPLVVPPRSHYRRHVEELRAALGPDPFAAAWAAGRALRLEQAVEEARAVTTDPATGVSSPPTGAPVAGPSLTRREREVVRLVAAGRTDREIAADLYIGERTVEWHLTNAFAKLGVSTRAAAASAAIRLGLI